ncbi:hypothetical protein SAMN04487917_102601 [Arthrobacter sp. yr096]|uniref:hypothetical protein n=1 Tax=unclassified Arthrobacter TaxID=235627 RepID=UPI0008987459|nr:MULTISPECIES: hypothetical protein [unclassified Arthrobacter]SDX56696.1 hypothetical protein SAMN04487912_11731 [Arthrobacter sp. cf158]SEI84548.1 hypothetical protein SAMN04487917_102601 [Arthrobacter sp. yr096]
MIASVASLATRIGTTLAAWIEAAYIVDCTGPEDSVAGQETIDLTWLPALSGVTVAGARAIQSHAERPRI